MASDQKQFLIIPTDPFFFYVFLAIHTQVMDASIALAVAEKALELITTGKPLPDVERLPR